MAENTTVNKVVINNETVIDITDTTATPGTVAEGEVFYKASGERAVGSRTFVTGVKGDSETDYRTGNVNLTKSNLGLGNVENKSSETIRSELTKSNVTNALGFTPYTQAEVDALVSAVFHYKGTKATYAEVAALTDMKTGDVWQVTIDNSEYVYNGTSWEKLGPTIDLSGYLTSVSVAGQTLTPSSNTITAAQLKTALGLGSAAYAKTETTLTNSNNLPTGSAVKSFVEGKGYTTNTGTITGVSVNGTSVATSGVADIPVPTKVSDLTNDSGFITSYTETDPTVPSWAKQPTKPTYTASEVGALPSSTAIPSKTSDLTNDSGFITSSDIPVTSVNDKTGAVEISKGDLGLGNVENKSSSTIRSELTKSNVTTALGYTPYTKAEVDALVSAVFHYKGTKTTYAEVAALTDMKTGDVWQVSADNSEYVYNGSAWEKLGPTIDLSGYLTSVSVAGHTLTPGSNSITVAQLKTALGLKSAAYVDTESTVANDAKLPTGAAVKSFVEGKGYTTNTGTVTKVSTGTGLTGGDITTSGTISLDTSGVTAGSAGPTAAVTGNEGTTVAIPRITVDKYGRVTGLTSYNLTNKNTTYSTATTSANGLMSSTDKGIVDTVKYKVSLTAENTIPANSDLNDTKWLKTGSYANPLSANTSTISNIPSGLTEAFMLNVYSPLSGNSTADDVTGNWIYRVQELTVYSWVKRWARLCYTDGSGTWIYPTWTQIYPTTVATGDSNGQVKIAGMNVSVKGLGSAAYVDTETTVANDAKLPTGAAVKSFVEGKGYTTNTGTVTKVSTGVGLTGGDITGTGTVKAKLKSETASTLDSAAMGSTANKQYAVGVDKSGYLSVNIPWSDTKYTAASAAPSAIGTAAVGTSKKYAREDHVHSIALASGDSNGQVKIAGTNVSVKGWNTAATYAVETAVANDTKLPTGAAVKTFVEGKGYTTNTGTVTKVSTGVGLTGGDVTTSGTIKAKLKSETASTLDSSTMGSTASRQYAVGVDKSGYLSVNIPWENTQTLTGVKGNSESSYRTGNVNITAANIGLGNVENKSSATIRGELTKANVTDALGYTPPTTDTDTKNTAGSTDTSSKIFLIGATSQAANPQTYSDNEVYATNGVLTTKSVQVGGGSATLQFNSETNTIDFIFA